MADVTIEGTIKSVSKTEQHKKDIDNEYAQVSIKNNFGETVNITGKPGLLNGMKPNDPVTVTIKKTQKTIAEAMKDKRK